MEFTSKDLSVTLQDRPGQLAKATEAIAKAGVNIDGYCVVPSGREGIFHFTTTDPKGARKALEGAGFTVKDEVDVLAVEVQNKPGALAKLLRPIADAEANVGVTYSLADGRIAFAGSDLSHLRQLIRETAPTAIRA